MPTYRLNLELKVETSCANKKALILKVGELHRMSYQLFGPQVEVQISRIEEERDREDKLGESPGSTSLKSF